MSLSEYSLPQKAQELIYILRTPASCVPLPILVNVASIRLDLDLAGAIDRDPTMKIDSGPERQTKNAMEKVPIVVDEETAT